MKHFFGYAAVRIIAIVILLAVTAALILYQAGKYDISFIPRWQRPAETAADGETKVAINDTTAADTLSPVTGDNISSISDPTSIGGSDTTSVETAGDEKSAYLAAYEAFISGCKTYGTLKAQGWMETGALYNSAVHALTVINTQTQYSGAFSYRTEEEPYTERIATALGYETQYKTRNVYRPAVKLYMGLIVHDIGDDKLYVYDRYGSKIASGINMIYDVFDRDADGNPLVRGGSKYYSLRTDGKFIETEYDPDTSKGVVYDAPEYYAGSGVKLYPYSQERTLYVMTETDERRNQTVTVLKNVPTEEFEKEQPVIQTQTQAPVNPADVKPIVDPLTGKQGKTDTGGAGTEPPVDPKERLPVYEYRKEKLWGFKDENGKIVVDAQYKAVYTFSDNGLAAVVSYNGNLLFINEQGKTVIDPYGKIVYLAERDNRQSFDGYYPADTKLPENLGMYYFDHGLVRVRRKLMDNYFKKRTATDSDYLIDKNGTHFHIPENYRLIAYSDGVLTLEKNGLYGYYSYKGYWIAQPIYTVCKPFVGGLGVIGFAGGASAMIDTSGNIVIPFVFDYISQPSGGVVMAYSKTGGWKEFIILGKPL